MDVLTALSNKSDYSKQQLQWIIGAWIMGSAIEKKAKISLHNGDVPEEDYDKASLYSLLYAIYRSTGDVRCDRGNRYEFTFNTWGYSWPEAWGKNPNDPSDPQRFGQNAYAGLYHFDEVQKYIADRNGKVHVIEMGCGTGAGANHVCGTVLKDCTYEAVDMQRAAIETCRRKFVGNHGGRLRATCSDATKLEAVDGSADFVAVNETHVTEMPGVVTEEDKRFFGEAKRVLKKGGYLVWGNAIPDATWQVTFDYLDSIGLKLKEQCDVTKEAISARDQDKARIDTYVDQAIATFHGFRIPVLGKRRREQAEIALKNFARNPGTNLYDTMVNRTDSYRVCALQKI